MDNYYPKMRLIIFPIRPSFSNDHKCHILPPSFMFTLFIILFYDPLNTFPYVPNSSTPLGKWILTLPSLSIFFIQYTRLKPVLYYLSILDWHGLLITGKWGMMREIRKIATVYEPHVDLASSVHFMVQLSLDPFLLPNLCPSFSCYLIVANLHFLPI